MSEEKVTYASYLMLHADPTREVNTGILDCLKPLSPVKEENLFIVTHQAFELWFKVVLIDLDDICTELSKKNGNLLEVNTSLDRICIILEVVVQQFSILETMSPMKFLEFRPFLKSGSGFQSEQFRLIENKIGIKSEDRVRNNDKDYKTYFQKDESQRLHTSEEHAKESSLLAVVQQWLESIVEAVDPSFWQNFNKSWKKWIEDTRTKAEKRDNNGEDRKSNNVLEDIFKTIESEEKYKEEATRRFSFKAFQGAMLVSLYRNMGRFHVPYQIIAKIKDIEKLLYRWRTMHVMMVHRMIGNKPGTGNSSGVDYLKATTTSATYNVFLDLYNTATYIIPVEYLPKLSTKSEILHST